MPVEPTVIGKIGRHKRHPERLAIINPDGKPLTWFAQDATDADVRKILADSGYAVDADGNVTQENQ